MGTGSDKGTGSERSEVPVPVPLGTGSERSEVPVPVPLCLSPFPWPPPLLGPAQPSTTRSDSAEASRTVPIAQQG
jgi:hypothetical protein